MKYDRTKLWYGIPVLLGLGLAAVGVYLSRDAPWEPYRDGAMFPYVMIILIVIFMVLTFFAMTSDETEA